LVFFISFCITFDSFASVCVSAFDALKDCSTNLIGENEKRIIKETIKRIANIKPTQIFPRYGKRCPYTLKIAIYGFSNALSTKPTRVVDETR
jgi:hypothetical protein